MSSENAKDSLVDVDFGRKLTFDNLDYKQEVHYMNEHNQNKDEHVVTVMCTDNRISGNHLSDTTPTCGILQMENGKCLPNHSDNCKQRDNYIILVERIITENISCLKSLSDVVTCHIPHAYKEEVSKKTNTVQYYIDLTLMSYYQSSELNISRVMMSN